MASAYGRNRDMVCVCGVKYDDFRTGMDFTDVRNMIITIGTDKKTGKTKYGRRSGVLGYWHELKMLYWDQHVGECESVKRPKRRSA